MIYACMVLFVMSVILFVAAGRLVTVSEKNKKISDKHLDRAEELNRESQRHLNEAKSLFDETIAMIKTNKTSETE